MDDQQGPTVEPRELCSALGGSLEGREAGGRMDTRIRIASPFAIHLKLSPHSCLAIPQYKMKIKLKVFFFNIVPPSFFTSLLAPLFSTEYYTVHGPLFIHLFSN